MNNSAMDSSITGDACRPYLKKETVKNEFGLSEPVAGMRWKVQFG